MKMRKRKIDLQARQLLGLRIQELLAQLDEAADLLIEALETGNVALDDDAGQPDGAGNSPAPRKGESG